MALIAGTTLGRYEIQAPLGRGGMGEVYLARDPLLGRTVAIKLLPTAFASDPDRLRRFEQEAQTTAALNHPRILAIHDIGRTAEQPFIVMEYVRGETLAAYLRRGRPSLARALEIGIEIAEALAAAHGARVVHRDLKPANIMVTGDGHIKVLDFGLAKFLWTDTSAPTLDGSPRSQTQSGHVLGTPGYMSPEQLFSDRVDERTDIYTLGVILFELVTGQRPYADVFDVLTGADPTTPVRTAREVDAAIPPAISSVIARAMARKPADRFQTAGELESELQRLLLDESSPAGPPVSDAVKVTPTGVQSRRTWWYAAWLLAGAIAVGIAAIPVINRMTVTDGARNERPVIAVLPLDNYTGDASKAYLGIGIADTLTTSLARLRSISVVSRSNLMEAGASTRPLAEIARNLDVTMLVRGSIQQVGDMLRVNASLEGLDGTVLWSGGEEASHDQLFAMQNRLAESLVAALRIRTTAAERQNLARAPTGDTEALDAYWRGIALLDRPDADFEEAVAQFKRATARDSGFSLAFAALGEAYRRRSVLTNDKSLMDQATVNVKKALDLDPDQTEVRLSLANLLRRTGQPAEARDEVRLVLTDHPENDNAHRLLGELLASGGQPDKALEELNKAVDLRPKNWRNQEAIGLFYYGNGKLREAVAAFTQLTQLKPNDAIPFQQLGSMYLAMGQTERARENFQRSNQLKENAGSYANLGTIEYAAGRYPAAVRNYERAVDLAPTRAVYQRNLGDAYQKVGRPADATRVYHKAIDLAQQALSVNQSDAATLSQLGVYYAKVGARREARQYADWAVQTNPTSPEVLYQRAVALALIGDRDGAVKQLSEAIDRGYALQLALDDEDLAALKSLPSFQRLAAAATPR